MKTRFSFKASLLAGLAAALFLPAIAADTPSDHWKWDATIYGLAAGMSGDVTVKGVNADVDTSFSTVLDNLQFGFMGKLRASKGAWSVTTDVIFMGLGAAKNGVSADIDQWVVEPTVSYRVSDSFEWLAGLRYNNLSGEIRGPGILPSPRLPTGTVDWFDPIIGFNYNLPLAHAWSASLRADVGGFGIGSDLTWQAFPAVNWRFSAGGVLQMGYRWVYNDYESGSGATLFRYKILTSGPQIGVNFRF